MYDSELALEIVSQIHRAARTIIDRVQPVKKISDFTDSPQGMEKLDSICMLLIAIGESLKNLDKVTNQSLLPLYPQIDWKSAKGMRDVISHHYFQVDAEIIFNVCHDYMAEMVKVLQNIISDLSKQDC